MAFLDCFFDVSIDSRSPHITPGQGLHLSTTRVTYMQLFLYHYMTSLWERSLGNPVAHIYLYTQLTGNFVVLLEGNVCHRYWPTSPVGSLIDANTST